MPIQFPTDFEDAGLKALVNEVVLDNKVTDNADKKYNYINGSNFFRFNPTTHDEQIWYIGKIQAIINTIVNEDMGNLWQRAEIERRIGICTSIINRCNEFDKWFAEAWFQEGLAGNHGRLPIIIDIYISGRKTGVGFNSAEEVARSVINNEYYKKPVMVMRGDGGRYKTATENYRRVLQEYIDGGVFSFDEWTTNYLERAHNALNGMWDARNVFNQVGRWGIWTNPMPYGVSPRTGSTIGDPPEATTSDAYHNKWLQALKQRKAEIEALTDLHHYPEDLNYQGQLVKTKDFLDTYNTRVAKRINSWLKFSKGFQYNLNKDPKPSGLNSFDALNTELQEKMGEPVAGGQFGIMQAAIDVVLASINTTASPIEPKAQEFIDDNIVSIRNAVEALNESVNKLSRIRKITINVGQQIGGNNVRVGTIEIPAIMNDSYIKENIVREALQELELKGQVISQENCQEFMDKLYEDLMEVFGNTGRDDKVVFSTTYCHSSCHTHNSCKHRSTR